VEKRASMSVLAPGCSALFVVNLEMSPVMVSVP
jgi:hypothetical protein